MSAPLKKPKGLPDASNLREVLSYNIRRFRVEKGWSQEYLAHECELDRTYISAVERCKWNVSLSNIEKIAHALDVQPWTLIKPPDKAP